MPMSRTAVFHASFYCAMYLVSAIAPWTPYPWLGGAFLLTYLPIPGGPSPRLLLSWRGHREIFNHPAGDWFRDPRLRRPALLAAIVIYLAIGASVVLSEQRLFMTALLLLLVPLAVVLQSTYGIAALPASVLDERQKARRDKVHLRSYFVVVALLFGLMIAAMIAVMVGGLGAIVTDPMRIYMALSAAIVVVWTLPSFLSAVGDRSHEAGNLAERVA
jgi:hypothetical protein